ncbi:MAG: hypothetical protein CBC34_012855 [Hyphomicrobiaceae bacterium TMED74]|nr:hypothetical protein [Filomicrobium sp.]RPG40372.1 MAG: hypothetical protein CBC34_012855 [Hyphomicrobiaceae bacterium TMED74]
MARIRSTDPIEFLIQRRFPSYWAVKLPPSSPGRGISPDRRVELLSEIASYQAELEAKSVDEIRELVRFEKERHQREIADRLLKEEQERFFNQPHAKADFDHYCKAATWTLDESVALSLGKEPLRVNWGNVASLVQVSNFARTYERRRDLVHRAKFAGQLYDPVYPSIFLAWAKDKFELPAELVSTAVDHSISLTGWKELYEGLEARHKTETGELLDTHKKAMLDLKAAHEQKIRLLTERLDSAQREIAEYAKENNVDRPTVSDQSEERPLKTRERESLQLIAFLGAVQGYGYDPDSRTDAAARIENDTDALSLRLSDDTVRNHLKRALDFIPPNWRERLNLKPNSDKA